MSSELGLKAQPFMDAYKILIKHGKEYAPRGKKVKEVENFFMTMHPIHARFTNFLDRKMNLNYAKKELLWYLRGDRFDTDTIVDAAQMWREIIDVDGGINSNYGQYIFKDQKQFFWVIEELSIDKDSRRAVMTLLNHTHLRSNNPDVVCTYSIGFRIRDNKLNMTIHMRSWDAIWGMTNDVFCFSCIYEMVYVALKEQYPELQVGLYHHTADSFHVYERHYEMLENLVFNGIDGFVAIECPRILNEDEVERLVSVSDPVDSDLFYHWLLT